MQEFVKVDVNTQELLQTLTPNVKKSFYYNCMNMFVTLCVFIGLGIYVNTQIDGAVFSDAISALGININGGMVGTYAIVIVVFFAAGMLLSNYLNLKNVKYEFFRDRIEYKQTQALVFIQKEVIKLENITRVTFTNEGTYNKMLKTGTVIIELSGIKQTKLEMQFMDNTAQVSAYIQNILEYMKSIKQMQFQENYKINDILKGF